MGQESPCQIGLFRGLRLFYNAELPVGSLFHHVRVHTLLVFRRSITDELRKWGRFLFF